MRLRLMAVRCQPVLAGRVRPGPAGWHGWAKGGEGAGAVALADQDVADFFRGSPKDRVARGCWRITPDQFGGDGQSPPVGGEGRRTVAPGGEQVADAVVADGAVLLPKGVGGSRPTRVAAMARLRS